jgi:hypothetical protein
VAEKVCTRQSTIAEENRKRLREMHPRVPEIDEKTMTIKGLLITCESPTYVVGGVVDLDDDQKYLCARCKKEIGGALEKNGAKFPK